MNYSSKTYEILSKAIDGDTQSRAILVETNKELAAFSDAVQGNKQAHHWLYDNGYYALSALLQALNKNVDALNWLMENQKELAALAGASVGDDESYQWLVNQGYYALADLSDTIKNIY